MYYKVEISNHNIQRHCSRIFSPWLLFLLAYHDWKSSSWNWKRTAGLYGSLSPNFVIRHNGFTLHVNHRVSQCQILFCTPPTRKLNLCIIYRQAMLKLCGKGSLSLSHFYFLLPPPPACNRVPSLRNVSIKGAPKAQMQLILQVIHNSRCPACCLLDAGAGI